MTVDTTPLKKVIDVWRQLNAERVEAMANGDDTEVIADFNERELFRLRDIAGEAMQLVDELQMDDRINALKTKGKAADKVWVAQLEWHGEEPGDYGGWVSVHATDAGARAMLETRATEYGLDLAAIDSGEDQSGSTYMLANLPIRE